MQNGSSVGICTRCVQVFAHLVQTCMLSRCLLTKFLHRSSVGSLLRVCCWLGSCFFYILVHWKLPGKKASGHFRGKEGGEEEARKQNWFFFLSLSVNFCLQGAIFPAVNFLWEETWRIFFPFLSFKSSVQWRGEKVLFNDIMVVPHTNTTLLFPLFFFLRVFGSFLYYVLLLFLPQR